MDSEEFDKVVLAVIEKVLNKMPDVIGNLMSEHARNNKLKEAFFSEHAEFKNHLDVVGAVLEKEESKEIGQDYSELLKRAVPKIQDQIRIKSRVNLVDNVKRESLDTNLDKLGNFGEL